MRNGRQRATSATPPRPQSSAAAYRRRLLEDVPEHRSPAQRDAAVVEATLAGAYPTSLLGAPGAAEGAQGATSGQLGSFLKRNMSAEKLKRTTLRYVAAPVPVGCRLGVGGWANNHGLFFNSSIPSMHGGNHCVEQGLPHNPARRKLRTARRSFRLLTDRDDSVAVLWTMLQADVCVRGAGEQCG